MIAIRSPACRAGLLLLLIGFIVGTGRAQSLSNVSAAFVDLGVDARAAAMGQSGVAAGDGMASADLNPASLSGSTGFEVGFSYLDQFELVRFAQADLGFGVRRWRISVAARDVGDEALRETTLGLTVARRIGRFGIGVSPRLLLATFGRGDAASGDYAVFEPDEISAGLANRISGDAMGFSLSLGARYAAGRAAFGVAVRNLVAPITWESGTAGGSRRVTYDEGLPAELVLGLQLPVGSTILTRMDYRPRLTDEDSAIIRAGVEWSPVPFLALRAGTERFMNDRSDDRFSLGFGLLPATGAAGRLVAGYAYRTSFLGPSQHVSLRWTAR